MTLPARLLAAYAGLLGAAGVAAAAASSHAGGALLGPLSLVALTHTPALLTLALHRPESRRLLAAAAVLALGTAVFCTDLAARHAFGTALFPLAAPLGGMLLIAGWLGVGAFAALRTRD